MGTTTRNDNERRGLSLTLEPMRLHNTPDVKRQNMRSKTAFKLLLTAALCGVLFHILENQQFSIPIYSSSLPELRSRNLATGDCEWVTPIPVNQDPEVDVFQTLLVSYPGAAKRATYMQLSGLTGLLTADDFYLTNNKLDRYAFYKSQYPHHEGIWSWKDRVSQSIYVLQNPRTALQDYMFLVSEIHYSDGWIKSFSNLFRTFTLRPLAAEWITWRDNRFNSEIHFWRWHIDYWMEGGLLRDVYTHELTTPEHFNRLLKPSQYEEAELTSFQNGLVDVTATYDDHCGHDGNDGDIDDCRPVTIVSYEHITGYVTGPEEVAKLAAVIENKAGINIIPEGKRQCLWEKIVTEGLAVTGVRDAGDRVGPGLGTFVYDETQILMIIEQLEFMYAKYNSGDWIDNPAAHLLKSYLLEYMQENKRFLQVNFP